MATPVLVNSVNGGVTTGTSTATLTLSSAPTSGNLLVIGVAVDKNGTYNIPSGFNRIVNLTSGSVGIQVFWKIAAGTETSVGITRTTNSGSGDNAWYGEFSQADSGTWGVATSATNNTNETNVNAWATGTTGAAAWAGLGVSFHASDSNGNAGSWSNGYAAVKNYADNALGSTGFGAAVQWIASLAVAQGATTGNTLTHTHVTPDQMSGAVVVFGKEPPSSIPGDVTAVAATAAAAAVAPEVLSESIHSGGGPALATALVLAPAVAGAGNLVAVRSTATATALAPSVAGVRNAAVSPLAALSTAALIAPSINSVATLTPPAASSAASAASPTVTGAAGALAAVASATAAAPAPTISASRQAAVVAPTATATATALPPTVAAQGSATTTAPPATATATALPPIVSTTGSAVAQAATATAVAAAPAPVVSTTANISAAVASSSAAAMAATVAGSRTATVAAVATQANAEALAVFVAASAGVAVPAALATALARPPAVVIVDPDDGRPVATPRGSFGPPAHAGFITPQYATIGA